MPNANIHTGTVQSISAGEAIISVAVQGCSSCGQKKSCGMGKLAGSGKVTLVRLPANAEMKLGDTVTLAVDQNAIHRAALVGYLVPAMGLVLGTIGGHFALETDVGAALGGLSGIGLGFLLARVIATVFPNTNAPISLLRGHISH